MNALKQARIEVMKKITIPKELRKFLKIKDGKVILSIKKKIL